MPRVLSKWTANKIINGRSFYLSLFSNHHIFLCSEKQKSSEWPSPPLSYRCLHHSFAVGDRWLQLLSTPGHVKRQERNVEKRTKAGRNPRTKWRSRRVQERRPIVNNGTFESKPGSNRFVHFKSFVPERCNTNNKFLKYDVFKHVGLITNML